MPAGIFSDPSAHHPVNETSRLVAGGRGGADHIERHLRQPTTALRSRCRAD